MFFDFKVFKFEQDISNHNWEPFIKEQFRGNPHAVKIDTPRHADNFLTFFKKKIRAKLIKLVAEAKIFGNYKGSKLN